MYVFQLENSMVHEIRGGTPCMAAACGYRGRLDGEAGGRRRCLVLAQAYVWVGEMSAGMVLWYWNQITGLTAHNGLPPLPPE